MGHYLVTGGCGFIGSHLVDSLLADGHRVRILDNLSTGKMANVPNHSEVIVADVADQTMVKQAMDGMDGCFHLAAVASVKRSNEAWFETHRSNLSGTINLFDNARRPHGNIPVVYASSAAVYGDNPNQPLQETADTRPLTAYGADKLGCELHARVAARVHDVSTFGFRFFNVYGPRQDPSSPYSGVISVFVGRIQNNQPIMIHGDGQQVRDFVYVDDVVSFLKKGMITLTTGCHIANVCTGKTTSIKELALVLFAIFAKEPQISHTESRTGDIRTSLGDTTHAFQTLGLKANIELADGLRKTMLGTGELNR